MFGLSGKMIGLVLLILLGIGGYFGYIYSQKAPPELIVGIITDIDHCPSREAASFANLDVFLKDLTLRSTDFVVSLGDNASHRLRECSDTGDMDARAIAEKIRSSGLPAHFVLGDHDIASEISSYQTWLETSQTEKTYSSFNVENVHIIILDTVLGGEPLSPPCTSIGECKALEDRKGELKSLLFEEYRKKYGDASHDPKAEKNSLEEKLEVWHKKINETRSWGVRDRGRIGEAQLQWLREDVADTRLERILILSDHPLFTFTSHRKTYDIANGDKVREILEGSGKQIVAISGEAHLWYEEKRNGIQYYIVDEFKKLNGSWAFFTWKGEGYQFEKITH